MTEFLVKCFVKEPDQVQNTSVRTQYGMLTGVVGIFCNVFLFILKFIVGFLLHSVSVTADAFNNLSDAGASIVSFIGIRMAAKPADEDHPFGHGRVEYIAAFVVSFLVLEVGFTFLKDSIEKIRTPEMLNFQWISLGILCISVGVKVWLGLFNRKLGKRINSKVMMAVFTDSMGDVITTSATIFSLLFFRFTNINIDGFVGVGVSLVVMWAGVGIAKDTLEPLIGAAVDPYLYEVIKKFVEDYDGVEGTHDLIVHNYGPNRSMASIHAEVPNNVDIEISHEIVDRIERDAMKELGIFLVVHMDPIEMDNEESEHIRTQVVSALEELDPQCSIHDFRLVRGQYQVNVIFDMVVPITYEEAARESLRVALAQKLKEVDERYCCVITIEHSFCSVKQTEE